MDSSPCVTKMLKSMSVLICIVTPVLLGVSLQGCGSAENNQLEKTPATTTTLATTTTTPTQRPLNPRTSVDLDIVASGGLLPSRGGGRLPSRFVAAVVEGCPAVCMTDCHPGDGTFDGTALDNKTCTHHCDSEDGPRWNHRLCYDSPQETRMRRGTGEKYTAHTVDCTGCPKAAKHYSLKPVHAGWFTAERRTRCNEGRLTLGACLDWRVRVKVLDIPLGSNAELEYGELEFSCVANSTDQICPDTSKLDWESSPETIQDEVPDSQSYGSWGEITYDSALPVYMPQEWVDTPIEMCFKATFRTASGLAYSSPATCVVSQLNVDPGGPDSDAEATVTTADPGSPDSSFIEAVQQPRNDMAQGTVALVTSKEHVAEMHRISDSSFIEAVQQPRTGRAQGTVAFATSKESPRKIGVGRHLPQRWRHK